AVAAANPRPRVDAAELDAHGVADSAARETIFGAAAAGLAADRRIDAARNTRGLAGRSSAGFPGRRRTPHARRLIARVRAAGAHARDQRGDDPFADTAWRGS